MKNDSVFLNFTGWSFTFDNIAKFTVTLTDTNGLTKSISHVFYVHDHEAYTPMLLGLDFLCVPKIILCTYDHTWFYEPEYDTVSTLPLTDFVCNCDNESTDL